MTTPRPGILVIEDPARPEGRVFEGQLIGAEPDLQSFGKRAVRGSGGDRGYGEVVFNTSMTGYQEILTDPSYYGEIVVMTVPHVGNTGVNSEDPESARAWCAGFVVHEACADPSNWRSEGDLDSYLKKYGIPGLTGVDTRAVTRALRTRGVARGLILPETERARAAELLKKLPAFEGRDMIGEVTTPKPYSWPLAGGSGPGLSSQAGKSLHVVAMDFGIKWNLLRSLDALGCRVEVVPATTAASEILARRPDGVFLSNGPGDPSAAPYAAETVRGLLGQVPIFGVCMGHQILAIALGGKTYKLKFGHRGGNQPVLDVAAHKVEISSHNHGYSVAADSLPAHVKVSHLNLNDKTVEGLEVPSLKAFSVQYHPEACPGPHDSRVLFERFVQTMENGKPVGARHGDVSKIP